MKEEKKKKAKKKRHDDVTNKGVDVINADATKDHPVSDEEDGSKADIQQNVDTTERIDPVKNSTNEVSTLNAYYGNFKGFLATVSMILNAGLMVYAHVGLSAVVLSSRPPVPAVSTTPTSPPLGGLCNENDLSIWQEEGGQVNRTIHSNFCSRQYNGVGCLLDTACIEECFATTFGYSQNCSTCFGAIPQCSFDSGCALICASDSFSEECQECNIPCTEQLDLCLGFPAANSTDVTRRRNLQEGVCVQLDIEELNWYVVYELTFINSIEKAWTGDAKLLAVIIVLFSGIWPYAKNIILVWLWYWPMTVERRTNVLTWLLRLSKYTLVDVFAVVSVLVGVLLQLNVGGTEVATRAEPRPSIIAFFLATVWEFTQIEWVVHCHNQHVQYPADSTETKEERSPAVDAGDAPAAEIKGSNPTHLLDAMKFRTKLLSNDNTLRLSKVTGMHLWVAFLLISTLALYLAGTVMEIVQFTSFGAGDNIGCKHSFNLVTFGNAMVSELALTANSAEAGTWTLYIAYVILVLFLPITVHCMQIVLLTLASFGENKERNRFFCKWTSSLWGFSSVEVLLIGLFSVEFKFEKFVSALAGNDNSQFFSVNSSLGPAFFILIVYSVMSGLLQYFIYCATAEYYHVDPYHKVNLIWTKLFGCWLEKKQ
ncbi:paraquat-inducible protein A domain containing protein [Nitzschia inconspicua]|uniref:Paraquat-inducible protein A domain containing protein n=1 Tax=Nitzschia inconspicua TaxID=303405 RepID=A0A9K3PEI0_9STRA|nr:paraquat-inducible protein A domain containing protein [Nitzschia inconspicua]